MPLDLGYLDGSESPSMFSYLYQPFPYINSMSGLSIVARKEETLAG